MVPFSPHFDFRLLPDTRVMESFASNDSVFAGVQRGIWPYDEYYWSERKGSWGGVIPLPARESVGNLLLQNAARETFGPLKEPLDRLPSDTPLIADSEVFYRENYYTLAVPDGAADHQLYSCSTGQLVAQAGVSGELGVVPNDSYLLWARTYAGNVFETGHGLARAKDGEWSVLRVVVGTGAWSLSFGCCPSPGAALYQKPHNAPEIAITPENEATYRVVFDPLARCVSASCVLDQEIKKANGTIIAPAGALLLGGLRASSSGPQTALWWLKNDGTAQILGLQTEFTDGVCECAKTNHFASDVVQSPSGELFVLTECALFRFNPDAVSVDEALPGYPAHTSPNISGSLEAGHPGGNCLRFPTRSEMIHWTENFGGVNDGTAHYNRMVRRVAGRDTSGPSTLWHGTNCADMFLGRFWAVRSDDNATLFLDWLDNGRWHGYAGMARDIATTFWQRLRTVNNALWIFGYRPRASIPLDEPNHTDGVPPLDPVTGKPLFTDPQGPQSGAHSTGDSPLCAVADGLILRDATFPFFVRRATPAGLDGEQTLLVAARAQAESIGPANRVVEILANVSPDGRTRICSLWNETEGAFRMSRVEFESLGGDPAKLPPFFSWHPQVGTGGGGRWKPAPSRPTSGPYLETHSDASSNTSALIRFFARPTAVLPYDVSQWDRLCFYILDDGSTEPDGPIIEPTCLHAQCALEAMPEGTRFRVIERLISPNSPPLTSFHITDASDSKRLSHDRDVAPTLWYRINSTAPRNDLSTYTHLASYDRLTIPRSSAATRLELVILIPPHSFPLQAHELPILQRRS